MDVFLFDGARYLLLKLCWSYAFLLAVDFGVQFGRVIEEVFLDDLCSLL